MAFAASMASIFLRLHGILCTLDSDLYTWAPERSVFPAKPTAAKGRKKTSFVRQWPGARQHFLFAPIHHHGPWTSGQSISLPSVLG
ncbi:hypothetical protein PSPO01_04557 [Paraphaeosphaeria sporulosa]